MTRKTSAELKSNLGWLRAAFRLQSARCLFFVAIRTHAQPSSRQNHYAPKHLNHRRHKKAAKFLARKSQPKSLRNSERDSWPSTLNSNSKQIQPLTQRTHSFYLDGFLPFAVIGASRLTEAVLLWLVHGVRNVRCILNLKARPITLENSNFKARSRWPWSPPCEKYQRLTPGAENLINIKAKSCVFAASRLNCDITAQTVERTRTPSFVCLES